MPTQVSDIHEDSSTISFHVSEIGKPVLVRTSYFPNWKVHGATGPYRVAPNMMVVVPTSHDVKLTYGLTAGRLARPHRARCSGSSASARSSPGRACERYGATDGPRTTTASGEPATATVTTRGVRATEPGDGARARRAPARGGAGGPPPAGRRLTRPLP